MSKILRIGYGTAVLAVILLVGSMEHPQKVLANPNLVCKTTAEVHVGRVALFTDKSFPLVLNDIGSRRIQDSESDLDHVLIDVSNPEAEIAQETAEKFVGRFAVNDGSFEKDTPH
jgi:hypothetical protein